MVPPHHTIAAPVLKRRRGFPLPAWGDVAAAAVLAYVCWWSALMDYNEDGAGAAALVPAPLVAWVYAAVLGACVAAVVIRRMRPATSILVIGIAAMVHVLVLGTFSLAGILSGFIAVETCTSRAARPGAWILLAGGYLEVGLVVIRSGATSLEEITPGRLAAVVAMAWTTMTVAALTGLLRRRSRERVEQALERAEVLAAQQETERRLALAHERQRIARDVHDLLGHSLSIIGMQAEGARAVLAADPDAASDALAVIGATARSSVDEVRALVDVLRSDEAAPTTPNPSETAAYAAARSSAHGCADRAEDPSPRIRGLEELPALVAASRRSGLGVRLILDADHEVPEAVGIAVYRVAQEALTNVIRHARAAPTTVRARIASDGLELEVVNAPARADGRRKGERIGAGLASMRDRVAQLGGRLEAGPTAQGGWRVHALLPVGHPGRPVAVVPGTTVRAGGAAR